jgi:hypothetical protein
MNKTSVGITAIWLRNLGDRLIVEVEIDGKWISVMDDFGGPMEFAVSHIVEARGVDTNKLSPMNAPN